MKKNNTKKIVKGSRITEKQQPELVNILVLGKFTDGKIRQILTNKMEQLNITHVLGQMAKDGKLKVIENTIDSIGWENDIDLRF